jgi:hypothetical protein
MLEHSRSRPLLFAAMLWVSGCASAREPASIVRDSAGIRIVENLRPAWSDGQGWQLDSIPELDVGPRETVFQVGPMYRLEDGRIIVAHQSTNEVLIYSPAGELLRRFGRRGSGPGEFREISGMFLIADGDSILVYDYPARLSVFDTDGKLGRTATVAAGGNPIAVRGAFDDGSLLVQSLSPPATEARGLVRQPGTLSRIDLGGSTTDLASIPGNQVFYQDDPTGGRVDFRPPFFAHTTFATAWRDRAIWAATDSFEIRIHTRDGRLISLVRRPHTPRAVTEADVTPLIEQRAVAIRDEATRASVRRILGNLPRGTFPAFGALADLGPSLQVDSEGNLWVAEFAMAGEARNIRAVFDSSGSWLGAVTLPSGFAPRHIGSDFVLGRWRDSLDVEHVRLYRLRKSE